VTSQHVFTASVLKLRNLKEQNKKKQLGRPKQGWGDNIRSGSWINTRQDMELIHLGHDKDKWQVPVNMVINLKADSHIACHARAIPLPCLATKGLECVFPI
jgi:hypothetical protein